MLAEGEDRRAEDAVGVDETEKILEEHGAVAETLVNEGGGVCWIAFLGRL